MLVKVFWNTVQTNLSTDTEPLPIYCQSNRRQSIKNRSALIRSTAISGISIGGRYEWWCVWRMSTAFRCTRPAWCELWVGSVGQTCWKQTDTLYWMRLAGKRLCHIIAVLPPGGADNSLSAVDKSNCRVSN